MLSEEPHLRILLAGSLKGEVWGLRNIRAAGELRRFLAGRPEGPAGSC